MGHILDIIVASIHLFLNFKQWVYGMCYYVSVAQIVNDEDVCSLKVNLKVKPYNLIS